MHSISFVNDFSRGCCLVGRFVVDFVNGIKHCGSKCAGDVSMRLPCSEFETNSLLSLSLLKCVSFALEGDFKIDLVRLIVESTCNNCVLGLGSNGGLAFSSFCCVFILVNSS